MWTKPSTDPTEPKLQRQKIPGRRIAQIVKLKPEYVEKYKEVHARVWPEVLKQIRDCRIEDCELNSEGVVLPSSDHTYAMDALAHCLSSPLLYLSLSLSLCPTPTPGLSPLADPDTRQIRSSTTRALVFYSPLSSMLATTMKATWSV